MLGGALGQFPLGGGPTGTTTVTNVSWFEAFADPVRYQRVPRAAVAVNNQTLAFNPLPLVSFGYFEPLSEPVRKKPGVRTQLQQSFTFFPTPLVSFGWFAELSKPVKLDRVGLRPSRQQFFTIDPFPKVSFSWFETLSEPKRFKRGLPTQLQQATALDTAPIPLSTMFQWLSDFSLPVRTKPGLKAALQQFLASPSRLLPTPTSFGVLSALETKDTFLAGGMLWNRATDAEIGVINTTPQPSEIGLYQTAPTAGTITVRISIIIG